MSRLKSKNLGSTTLTATMSNVATSVTVADATKLPAAPFRATIKNEIIEVGAVASNTLSSILRAQEGTTAGSYSIGDVIENKFTAGAHDELVSTSEMNTALALKSDTSHTHATYLPVAGGTITGTLGITGTTKAAGVFYAGTATPTNTTRLNFDGVMYFTQAQGAGYNDYAELRQSKDDIACGLVAIENGDGYITQCMKRLSKTPMVISDTHGFLIGIQGIEGEYSLPIAVAGRVLVFPDRDRNSFKVGDAVCSGINGTVSKMKWWERILFPDRILGTVSEIPNYLTWGTGKVIVGKRIWIRI